MTYMENTLYHLGEEVELLVAQGVQLKDIAILVRKNRSIPLIADYFDKNTSYKSYPMRHSDWMPHWRYV